MTKENDLSCSIIGSFKFKPEIDMVIEEFEDLGVKVLAPNKGWLYVHPHKQVIPESKQYRPLPLEKHMSLRQVEDRFIDAINRSKFVYIVNPHGYIGASGAFEFGIAMGQEKPIFLQEEVDYSNEPDPLFRQKIERHSQVKSPSETVIYMRAKTP